MMALSIIPIIIGSIIIVFLIIALIDKGSDDNNFDI
jgi:hypothetical protein